jgi:hypothetical protein
METTFQSTIIAGTTNKVEPKSIITRFTNWCKGQEKNRIGWLGGILAIHGCVITPITLFAIILSGTYFPFYAGALVAIGMVVVTNLAAMPTKITIPVFFFSVLIDIAIIIECISIGFDLASTQI